MKISLRKKEKGIHCCAYGCSNSPVAKKGGLCHKHYARKIRLENPMYARYNQFCSNARKRRIVNTVTWEQFQEFCHRTGYIIQKGKRGQNATLDRIKNQFGYHHWNLQLLTGLQNVKKWHNEDEPCEERFADVPF